MSSSPFKFLDPYGPEDRDRFFGREREVDDLARLLTRGDLVLIYGASGTGKTSLIDCGLSALYRDIDWLPIMVRRGTDINDALAEALRAKAITPIPAGAAIVDAVRSVFLDHLRPVHLVLDQFEEVLLGGSPAEQQQLFADLATLLAARTGCKILISMREEYFALLTTHEQQLPELFDRRLRVEPMTPRLLQSVIVRLAAASGVGLAEGEATAAEIVARLASDQRGAFQLPFLQIYLDRLWRNTLAADGEPVFSSALIARTGSLETVLEAFLDEQVDRVEARLAQDGVARSQAQSLLEQFVTVDATRQAATIDHVCTRLAAIDPALVRTCLQLLVQGRILRPAGPDRYELAHDSLAALIDQRRSAESRKDTQMLKMVRAGVAKRGEVKEPWLTAEELTLVASVLDRLDLTDDERGFVRESQRFRKKARWLKVASVSAGMAVLAMLAIISASLAYDATETSTEAQNSLNEMTQVAYEQLRQLPQTDEIKKELFRIRKINADYFDLSDDDTKDVFWDTILDGDKKFDNRNFAAAVSAYESAVRNAENMLEDIGDNPYWLSNHAIALQREGQARLSLAMQGEELGPVPDTDIAAKRIDMAEQIASKLVSAHDDPMDRQILARVRITRIAIAARRNDFKMAETSFVEAEEDLAKLIADDKPLILLGDQALLYKTWGESLLRQYERSSSQQKVGIADDALDAFNISFDNYMKLMDEFGVSTLHRRRFADLLMQMARLQITAYRKNDVARMHCEDALSEVDFAELLEWRKSSNIPKPLQRDKKLIIDCWGLGPVKLKQPS